MDQMWIIVYLLVACAHLSYQVNIKQLLSIYSNDTYCNILNYIIRSKANYFINSIISIISYIYVFFYYRDQHQTQRLM